MCWCNEGLAASFVYSLEKDIFHFSTLQLTLSLSLCFYISLPLCLTPPPIPLGIMMCRDICVLDCCPSLTVGLWRARQRWTGSGQTIPREMLTTTTSKKSWPWDCKSNILKGPSRCLFFSRLLVYMSEGQRKDKVEGGRPNKQDPCHHLRLQPPSWVSRAAFILVQLYRSRSPSLLQQLLRSEKWEVGAVAMWLSLADTVQRCWWLHISQKTKPRAGTKIWWPPPSAASAHLWFPLSVHTGRFAVFPAQNKEYR